MSTAGEELENLERIAAGMTPSIPPITRAVLDTTTPDSYVLHNIDEDKAWRIVTGRWMACCPQCYMLEGGHKMDCSWREFIFDRLPPNPMPV